MVRFGDSREPAQPPRWLSDDGAERYGRFILRAALILLAFYGAPTVAIFSVAPLGALVPDLLILLPLIVAAIARRLDLGELLLLSVLMLIPWVLLASAFSG
jgi:hypothetical protein